MDAAVFEQKADDTVKQDTDQVLVIANGTVFEIMDMVREVDDDDGSATVWLQVEEL